jgi:hypothetical protein
VNSLAAESTSILLIKLNAALDAQLARIEPECSAAEFDQVRLRFGRAMGALLDVLNPIYQEHPRLKPQELGGSYELPPTALASSTAFLLNAA